MAMYEVAAPPPPPQASQAPTEVPGSGWMGSELRNAGSFTCNTSYNITVSRRGRGAGLGMARGRPIPSGRPGHRHAGPHSARNGAEPSWRCCPDFVYVWHHSILCNDIRSRAPAVAHPQAGGTSPGITSPAAPAPRGGAPVAHGWEPLPSAVGAAVTGSHGQPPPRAGQASGGQGGGGGGS